jgi:hypothetical protein
VQDNEPFCKKWAEERQKTPDDKKKDKKQVQEASDF